MNIILPDKLPTQLCVFVMTCNEKEYIGHTTNLEWLAIELSKTYGKYQRGGIDADNLYFPLLRQYHNMERPKILVAVVFETDNGYDLLRNELELLTGMVGTSKCLNISPVPYIPKTIHAKKGSKWLTQNQYLNFMKLLKKYKLKIEQQ